MRRGERRRASFYLRVVGKDRRAVVRQGDISISGLYCETPLELGEVGAMERLELSSLDGARAFSTPAVLVRRELREDLWRGRRLLGVAFRFMPESDAAFDAIQELVWYLAG